MKDKRSNFIVKKGSAEHKEKLGKKGKHWRGTPAEAKEPP